MGRPQTERRAAGLGSGRRGSRPNGDSQRLLSVFHVSHMAPAVQDPAGLDHQAGRMDFAADDSFREDFHPPFGRQDAFKSPAHHYMIAVDFAFDPSVFPNDYGGVGNDCPFHIAVDAERPSELDFPFERNPFVEKADPLARRRVALAVQ